MKLDMIKVQRYRLCIKEILFVAACNGDLVADKRMIVAGQAVKNKLHCKGGQRNA